MKNGNTIIRNRRFIKPKESKISNRDNSSFLFQKKRVEGLNVKYYLELDKESDIDERSICNENVSGLCPRAPNI